jgi:hypothetical protein
MAHPDGTKAWRKSWRKRWRDGSSYRGLSVLAREIVRYVEDNADDAGKVTTTIRHLTAVMACRDPRLSPPRMTVWRALQEAVRAEILRTDAGQQAGQQAGHAPTTITRVNFREYQEREEGSGTTSGTGLEAEAGLSGRREQKKAEKKTTPAEAGERAPHPDWHALIEAINGAWTQKHKAKLVWHGKDWKPLRALLESVGADEIIRRWTNYLANDDKFYAGHPLGLFLSQVNRFVVGRVEQPSFREPWEGESPTGPGSPEWPQPSPEQLAEWEAQAASEYGRRGGAP